MKSTKEKLDTYEVLSANTMPPQLTAMDIVIAILACLALCVIGLVVALKISGYFIKPNL